eukprot:335015-Pelagomonas_calceolata.AAC.4
MEPSGKRHRRVKEEEQRTRKHTSAKESRRGDVTGRRNVVIPSLINFESVDAKVKSGHTAHDVFGQIQVQVSRMISRELSSGSRMLRPEAHHKLAQILRIENHEHDVGHFKPYPLSGKWQTVLQGKRRPPVKTTDC